MAFAPRLAELLALCALVSGCHLEPFEIEITNASDVALFLDGGVERPILFQLEQQVDENWRSLGTELSICQSRCGSNPLAFDVCVGDDPGRTVAFALLPGESTRLSFEEKQFYSNGSCLRRAPADGALRLSLCHDDAIENMNDVALPTPAQSGPIEGGEVLQALLVEPLCETRAVEVVDGVAELDVPGS
ncbi:MAG: hypothetical protein KDA24_16335 [Deltaproteobacteria bacterium]|nr:hypothetical protein [Deltaproteobacteria bacterium]